MKKLKIIILSLIGLVLLIGLAFLVVKFFKPKAGGILIETVPASTVFIDNEQVGRTPYKETRKTGEIIVRLIPDSFEKPLAPYETKVTLVSGVETVIRRNFADTSDNSSGEIISFENIGGNDTSLAIVTVPDSAQVVIDGQEKAFAPYKTSSIVPGDHTIDVSANGYNSLTFKVKTYQGYTLTAIVDLSPNGNPITPSNLTPTPTQEPQTYVEILSTPVGFLRVRSQASAGSEEVGRVVPGKDYLLVDENSTSGWYEIQYDQGKNGWISNQYAKKVTLSVTPTPFASTTPSPVSTQSSSLTKTPTNQY